MTLPDADNPWLYQEHEDPPAPTDENSCPNCGGERALSFKWDEMSLYCHKCKTWTFQGNAATWWDNIIGLFFILVFLAFLIGAVVMVASR